MSLDGFIAGPNISPQYPMGVGGMRLHDWLFDKRTDTDTKVLNETIETSGAVIFGGQTYRVAIDNGWGGCSPFQVPAFVLTRHVPEKLIEGFIFVTDGIQNAVEQVKAIAGSKNIWIMGGANIAQQFIKAGLLDEVHIHLVPVLLSRGTRLFDHTGNRQIELEKINIVESPDVTHIKFRVIN